MEGALGVGKHSLPRTPKASQQRSAWEDGQITSPVSALDRSQENFEKQGCWKQHHHSLNAIRAWMPEYPPFDVETDDPATSAFVLHDRRLSPMVVHFRMTRDPWATSRPRSELHSAGAIKVPASLHQPGVTGISIRPAAVVEE